MGQTQIKQKNYLGNQWQINNQSNSIIKFNNPYSNKTLENIYTRQLIEEYQLVFSSELDVINYQNQLQYRKEQGLSISSISYNQKNLMKKSKYLYKIRSFLNVTEQDVCSNNWKGLLYMSKIDVRLTQIKDIPFQDGLYLIKACLQGFKILYQKVGYFDIIQDMIFITKKGQVKVWLNPNLAVNQPYYISKNLELYNCSQSLMIVNLLSMIQDNIDKYRINPILFKQFLIKKRKLEKLSFYTAIEEFQLYVNSLNLHYRQFMKSVYEIFHDKPIPIQRSLVYKIQTQNSEIGDTIIQPYSLGQSRYMMNKSNVDYRGKNSRNFMMPLQIPQFNQRQPFFNDSLATPKSSSHLSISPKMIKKSSLNKLQRIKEMTNEKTNQIKRSSIYQISQTPINNLQALHNPTWDKPHNPSWQKPSVNQFSFSKIHKDQALSNSLVVDNRHLKITNKLQNQPLSYRSQQINNFQNVRLYNTNSSSTFSLNPSQSNRNFFKKFNQSPKQSPKQSPRLYQLNNQNSFKYFAIDKDYVIDSQIAQDIHKQFGIHPNDI